MSRVQIEIFLGTILVLITGGLLIYTGLNENNRMADFAVQQQANSIEVGAVLFETNCTGCHGPSGLGILGLGPPLNDKYFFTQRLKDVGWGGSQEDYIIATVSSGRLISTRPSQYPGSGKPAMPSWSDRYGGPLRDDQIRSLADFIMNWQATAQEVTTTTTALAGPPVGTDIAQQLPAGDPVKGQALANSKGCVACHVTTATGPAWNASGNTPGIGTRASTRITQSDYTGKAKNAQQYLLESIVVPNAYVVPTFQPNVMPQTFGQTLTAQDASDLIAYILTIK
jgi:mono/diheme cytochrome c family protein